VDLGTANTLIYVEGRGIVLDEPTVIAMDNHGEVVRYGQRAKEFLGKSPPNLQVIRPMKEGVIRDFSAITKFIHCCLRDAAQGRRPLSPRVIVCVPSQITVVEKRAVMDAVKSAGYSKVFLIDEVMAAAIGCGTDLVDSKPVMVVDIGGGTTEMAVISEMAYLCCRSRRIAGTDMDEAIESWLRREYGIWIGPNSAERLKWEHGAVARDLIDKKTVEIAGKDLDSRRPARCTIDLHGLVDTLVPYAEIIAEEINEAILNLEPGVRESIEREGVLLTGGSSLLRGLRQYLQEKTGLSMNQPPSPLTTVITGAGKAMEDFQQMRPVFVN